MAEQVPSDNSPAPESAPVVPTAGIQERLHKHQISQLEVQATEAQTEAAEAKTEAERLRSELAAAQQQLQERSQPKPAPNTRVKPASPPMRRAPIAKDSEAQQTRVIKAPITKEQRKRDIGRTALQPRAEQKRSSHATRGVAFVALVAAFGSAAALATGKLDQLFPKDKPEITRIDDEPTPQATAEVTTTPEPEVTETPTPTPEPKKKKHAKKPEHLKKKHKAPKNKKAKKPNVQVANASSQPTTSSAVTPVATSRPVATRRSASPQRPKAPKKSAPQPKPKNTKGTGGAPTLNKKAQEDWQKAVNAGAAPAVDWNEAAKNGYKPIPAPTAVKGS